MVYFASLARSSTTLIMMVAALLLCLYRSAQVASASPTTSSRLNLKTLVRESAELYHAPHYAQVMTEIQKARDSSSPNDLYSDFKTGTWHTGDFETYDENCVENTFVFVNLTIPNSYSMILSAPFQPADRILLSACLKGLKDSYHLCGIKVENISSSACVRFHYDEKLETVKVAINLNSLSCMAPTFDYDGKCSLEESSIPEFIFYYSAPGDNSMMLRNVVAIVVLSLLVCCCACVGVVGGYFGYRYFKNRNNTKKPSHSGNIQLDPQEQYAELEDI